MYAVYIGTNDCKTERNVLNSDCVCSTSVNTLNAPATMAITAEQPWYSRHWYGPTEVTAPCVTEFKWPYNQDGITEFKWPYNQDVITEFEWPYSKDAIYTEDCPTVKPTNIKIDIKTFIKFIQEMSNKLEETEEFNENKTKIKETNMCKCGKVNWYNEINRVIYNIKYITDENGVDIPILTTVVIFNDGSRAVVKNTKNDKIELITHDDGTVTASEDSKRLGLMYAVTQRMLGKVDPETLNVIPTGYMNKLSKIIDKATNVNQETARRAKQKKEAQERHKRLKTEADERRQKRKEKNAENKYQEFFKQMFDKVMSISKE